MLGRDGLLVVLLGDLVGLGGDERDELDAGVGEGVAEVLGGGEAVGILGWQDLCEDLLHGRCQGLVLGLGEGMGERQMVCFWRWLLPSTPGFFGLD